MSNRERWIVYPLLFYALTMGFKATYRDPERFRCRTIECQQLKVQMINGSAALASPSLLGPQLRALRYYFRDDDRQSGADAVSDPSQPLADPLAVDHSPSDAETPSETPAVESPAGDAADTAAGAPSPDESQ